ncbi:MAG: hypothetical protein IT186_16445 [Acidobacteria bacterium]|nr:hypothetical protein [Acidobacteriota bacterium]MCG3194443.1 hypothetical protein [Thermoanaerobaculia bacterium]
MSVPIANRLLLASTLMAFALPAGAVIDKIEHPVCGDRRPNETIQMRNSPQGLDGLWVYGLGVDLAQRVTVSGITGVSAKIERRKGGIGSAIELIFTIPPDVKNEDEGRVTLHYPLGEDSFRIKVFSRPQIASITIDAPPSGPVFVLRVGQEYLLTVRGRDLAKLELRPNEEMRQIASHRVESKDNTQIRIRVRALKEGRFNVHPLEFHYGGPECLNRGVVRLPGAEQLQVLIRP